MNIDVKDVLFWIFLILGLVLLVWFVFGGSPTEFAVTITLIFTILLKMWSISDRQIISDIRQGNLEKSFIKLASDFKEHVK